MNPHSQALFRRTFEQWRVTDDYADPMYNYLVLGLSPGSFFTSVLANDCLGAFQRSHSANRMQDLKNLAGWIRDHVPEQARGSYSAVQAWTETTEEYRHQMLEAKGMKHPPTTETWLMLQEPSPAIYSSEF